MACIMKILRSLMAPFHCRMMIMSDNLEHHLQLSITLLEEIYHTDVTYDDHPGPLLKTMANSPRHNPGNTPTVSKKSSSSFYVLKNCLIFAENVQQCQNNFIAQATGD